MKWMAREILGLMRKKTSFSDLMKWPFKKMWEGAKFKADPYQCHATYSQGRAASPNHGKWIQVVLLVLGLIFFGEGSVNAAHSDTVFQEISGSLEALFGVVFISASAIVHAIYISRLHSIAGAASIQEGICQLNERLAKAEDRINGDAAERKAARDRTNQLLEWLGTIKAGPQEPPLTPDS
jgi:hypothetical protein